MHPGRAGRSLGERAANSGVRPPPPAREPSPGRITDAGPDADSDVPDPVEGRHCWVRDPPQAPGTWPGLLVEWRRRAGAWQGRVAFTVAGPDGPALVETWLPAERLEPR
ncbi:MAG: uncharacterized protein JWO98_3048 [Frankiales bacterium]|nr:uncharacterized protein [Frankiales bacterium]